MKTVAPMMRTIASIDPIEPSNPMTVTASAEMTRDMVSRRSIANPVAAG